MRDIAHASFGGESEFVDFFLEMRAKSFPAQGPVLRFSARNAVTCWAIPGKTMVGGRLAPFLGSARFSTELAIVPLSRYAPPFYIERTFYANAVAALNTGLVGSNITALTLQPLAGTDRPTLTASIDTLIENVEIEGSSGTKLQEKLTHIAIAGDVIDYALITRDFSIVGATDQRSEQYGKDIAAMIDSFRPLRVADEGQKRDNRRREADAEFARAMKRGKDQMFLISLDSTATLLKSLDLRQNDQIEKAVRQVRGLVHLADHLDVSNDIVRIARDTVQAAGERKYERLRMLSVHVNRFLQARTPPRPRRPATAAAVDAATTSETAPE